MLRWCREVLLAGTAALYLDRCGITLRLPSTITISAPTITRRRFDASLNPPTSLIERASKVKFNVTMTHFCHQFGQEVIGGQESQEEWRREGEKQCQMAKKKSRSSRKKKHVKNKFSLKMQIPETRAETSLFHFDFVQLSFISWLASLILWKRKISLYDWNFCCRSTVAETRGSERKKEKRSFRGLWIAVGASTLEFFESNFPAAYFRIHKHDSLG